MQLDNHRIAVRERDFLDVLDLSLRVMVTYAGPLALAFAAGIVPAMLLNAWLLSDMAAVGFDMQPPVGYIWWMLLLVLWEIPLATAPATLYLGQAVFTERPEHLKIARQFGGSLVQLILYQVILRGLTLPMVITWIVPFAVWPYLNEVILLERNPLRSPGPARMSTYRRTLALHSGMSGDLFGRWLLSVLIGIALFFSVWLSMWLLGMILFNVSAWEGPAYTVYLPVSLWATVAFFTVVRFLGYLDLRIRREGWEVELMMRAEQARLTRKWV